MARAVQALVGMAADDCNLKNNYFIDRGGAPRGMRNHE